jgi:glycosyltransferase involved in cell wall biosynthesis
MKQTKKIAVICNYSLNPNRIGGMDRFFVAYDRACREKGFQVDWFFSNCKPHSFYEDIKVFASQNISAEEQFLKQFETLEKYDVVVTHFIELCTPFFRKIKKKQKAYTIAVDHNPRPLNGFLLKKRIRNKLKGRLYSRYIDCFVGVSQYTTDCILEDYGSNLRNKTKVVYNGIDTSVYLKRTEENLGKFIVASHLRASKGIQDLISAVDQLPDGLKGKIKIDIFGEGPMETELKEKTVKLKLENIIQFKGCSPNLPDIFKDYSYLIQPTYMECFSLSILESLAANVPVLTTNVGGNPEIISEGKTGFIFKAGDICRLASLLEEILQKERKIKKDVSILIKQEFPLQKMVEEHLKLLPDT